MINNKNKLCSFKGQLGLGIYIDYIIFGLVVSYLIFYFIRIFLSLIDSLGVLSYNDAITYMSNPGSGYPGSGYSGYPSFPNNPASNSSAYSTQVAIIYNDGS